MGAHKNKSHTPGCWVGKTAQSFYAVLCVLFVGGGRCHTSFSTLCGCPTRHRRCMCWPTRIQLHCVNFVRSDYSHPIRNLQSCVCCEQRLVFAAGNGMGFTKKSSACQWREGDESSSSSNTYLQTLDQHLHQ